MDEQVYTNAKIVLSDQVVLGSLCVKDGVISDISDGSSNISSGINCNGDYLMPGFVELHTDNLEKHMTPRPNTEWPPTSAVIAHDNEIAAAGITTVLDAISLGDIKHGSTRIRRLDEIIAAVCDAADHNLLKSEHLLHLRCEVSYANLPKALSDIVHNPRVKMLSVMDHTPGQRQFVNLDAYYIFYQGKYGLSDEQIDEFIRTSKRDNNQFGKLHRDMVVAIAKENKIALASHDDATVAHVNEAKDDGVVVAEFPTTLAAATHSHQAGISVMMGSPNIVRGKSHAGNVSARALAEHGYLDIIASDYVPHSLLQAAMILFDDFPEISLPDAIKTISKTPANRIGMDDRGEITPGKRADLVRVHHSPHHPIIRGVWSAGQRIA